MEERILVFWKEQAIFQKSMTLREGMPEYVFYEGPPTANGRPGVHHVLARSIKDMFLRFRTMRGFHVVRRGGWDTHGLPVELEVEKQLGFTRKQQIEEFGIARFNALCRKSAFDYIQDWEAVTERIAYWVDFGHAYVTFQNDYIESVWWILNNFWERQLLYQGYKVVPYCPRCGTPLSDHEVAQGYREAVDPSVYVRFPLEDEPGTSLLVWTTTPWTLPANVAVAVHPDVEYVRAERDLPDGGRERLVLARSLLTSVLAKERYQVLDSFRGEELQGRRYRPLFRFLSPDKPAYRVVLSRFVTTEDGTGLVHIAPAFGAEDMEVASENDLPLLMTVNPDGTFVNEVTPYKGTPVKEADSLIIRDLKRRGLIFRDEVITHTYPFCWRCSTPLLYLARSTWYIRTSQFKDMLVKLNEKINWYPSYIKEGRFGNWLEHNVDWALGRERYWGTPLPIWVCSECHRQLSIGSVAALSKLAGRDLSSLDLHRPYVDEVHLSCPDCGAQMNRVPELIDVWFDSGSMPVAQHHYPFENTNAFHKQFPADFICEAVDQTRGWFYSLHAISTLLFQQESFRNAISLGLVLDAEGRKMSKSSGNVVDPGDVLTPYGADAFRWYLYTSSPPDQDRRFSVEMVGDVMRNFTLTIWNVYSFFVTFANLDKWQPEHTAPAAYSALDRWLLSSLHTLLQKVTEAFEHYDVVGATRPIQQFVHDLSRWYLRRSRRRFWKNGSDEDKGAAYNTLYTTLVTLSKMLAPTMPFLAEEMYQNLVVTADSQSPESVHLADWPESEDRWISEPLNRDMALVMKLASLGHAARNKANRKVRQPLSEAAFLVANQDEFHVLDLYADLLADELNVKRIRPLDSGQEVVSYSLVPLPKQLGQKYGPRFPKIRRALLALDPAVAAQELLKGQALKVTIDDEELEILPAEVEIHAEAHSGLAVASEGPYLAALATELTPELITEGLAREFVRCVQDFRKQAGLEIADRIRLYCTGAPELLRAVQTYREYISGETLAVDILFTDPPRDALVAPEAVDIDGQRTVIGLVRVV